MSRRKRNRRGLGGSRTSKSQSKKDNSANYMDYEVGYCKPPIHSRFKKGQSGNPAGRTKEPTTFLATLNKALSKPINLVEDGRKCQITTLMGVVKMYIKGLLSPDNYKYMKLFIEENAPDINLAPILYPEPPPKPPEPQSKEIMAIKALINSVIKEKLDAGEPIEGYPKPEKVPADEAS